MKTKIAPSKFYELLGLENYPNFSKNGSIKGMKELYYGKNAKLIKCGNYIYNVSSTPELYDNLYDIINELENFENDNYKIRFDIHFQYDGKNSAEWGGDSLEEIGIFYKVHSPNHEGDKQTFVFNYKSNQIKDE